MITAANTSEIGGRFYLHNDGKLLSTIAFNSIYAAKMYSTVDHREFSEFVEFIQAAYGFRKTSQNKLSDNKNTVVVSSCSISVNSYLFYSPEEALRELDKVCSSSFRLAILTPCSDNRVRDAILCGMSTKEFTKNLVRVKSSNLWAYGLDVRKPGDNKGNLYIQFKGNKGGPGDVYMYFDVPVRLWRQFLSAPSAGHFFWVNIRNNFLYKKLTGDKKTKLRNGV